jgi:hypothetical protein
VETGVERAYLRGAGAELAPLIPARFAYWLRPASLIAAGALGGTIVALGFAWSQQGALIRVHMPLPGGAVLGALVGVACW